MFTIPNSGSAENATQAQVDSRDFDILLAGLSGTGVVGTGCAVTAQGSPNMTVAVASGSVLVAGVSASVSAGNVTITTADGTNDRFDLICVNSSGTKSAVAGTPSSNPVFPDPAGKVVLAAVRVPAGASSINSAKIVDKRVPAVVVSIGDRTIVNTKLVVDTITANEIAPNAIGSSELADNAVDANAIQTGAVTQTKLATPVMQGKRIEAGRVTGITMPASADSPNYVDVAITYGTAFGSVPSLTVTVDETNASPDNDGAINAYFLMTSSTTGATVRLRRANNSIYSNVSLNWLAIG